MPIKEHYAAVVRKKLGPAYHVSDSGLIWRVKDIEAAEAESRWYSCKQAKTVGRALEYKKSFVISASDREFAEYCDSLEMNVEMVPKGTWDYGDWH
jgi:hypothetical protein